MAEASESPIVVRGAGKKFCRNLRRSLAYGVADIARDVLRLPPQTHVLRDQEFWAFRDVDLEVKKGECLGLIGKNGAGKTTLLKLINGLIKPDTGTIRVNGNVGALIALNAGFNPILTGRENIFVNGAVLGLSRKQVAARFDEIVEFSELEDFIDTPVQSYSSGMQVRLGFAIATAINPEVLLLDEVLAVGDAQFRSKCYNRVSEIQEGTASVLVSHSMPMIQQMCNRILYMRSGKALFFENAVEGIQMYEEDQLAGYDSTDGAFQQCHPPLRNIDVRMNRRSISHGDGMEVELFIESDEPVDDCRFCITAYNIARRPVVQWRTERAEAVSRLEEGRSRIKCMLSPLHLINGNYDLTVHVYKKGRIGPLAWLERCGDFTVTGPTFPPFAHDAPTYQLPIREFSVESRVPE